MDNELLPVLYIRIPLSVGPELCELPRMLFPRTPVNRVQEKRKDRGDIGPSPISCFRGSVSHSLGRYLLFLPRQHPIGGLGLHVR
jgi:hypothetical protein